MIEDVPTTSPPDPEPGRRRLPWLALPVVGFLVMALFWIWIFSGAAKKENPDYLADRDWAAEADATCERTVDAIYDLPTASSARTADERADTLDAANDLLDRMLADLADPPPDGAADREVVSAWLADWRSYMTSRRNYAADVRTDPAAVMLVEEKFNDPIDTVIEIFASVNEMPNCIPPDDVG